MLVFREVQRLVFGVSTRCWQRMIVFVKICSSLSVMEVLLFVVVLTVSFLSVPFLHRVLGKLGNRKQLSGRKVEWPSPFSIVGVLWRGASLPFEYCGCNVWCFVRFRGWFSTRRRVVDKRIIVLLSSSWHSKTAELFLWEFPADTTWRWELVVRLS
jgi:hypothetical protein